MEEPGYRGAHQAFRSAGVQMAPMLVDSAGRMVKEAEEQCPLAKGAYLTPSHQYPTGTTMSAGRRVEILQWATHGSWIIEDDYDSEFRFDSRPIGALQGLDTNYSVVYVGTFSKVLFPTLRLGYVVIPAEIVKPFTAIRRSGSYPPGRSDGYLGEAAAPMLFEETVERRPDAGLRGNE